MMIEVVKNENAPRLPFRTQQKSGKLTCVWRPQESRSQTIFKVLALCFWTVAGYVAFCRVIKPTDNDNRTFLIFWLMAWAAGWIYSIYKLAWILLGSQTAIASKQALTIVSQIGPIVWTRHYRPDQISHFRWTKSRATRHFNSATNPIRQPSIVNFDHGGKTINILEGIGEPDADALIAQFKEALQIKRASE